jgi:hypothetical protein
MKATVPLRRHVTEDWFRPMVKIESSGLNSAALDLRRIEGTDVAGNEVWEAYFTADTNGEVLVYVNDATIFGLPLVFYPSNRGSAHIAIELKPR